jgi:competence protein ComEA
VEKSYSSMLKTALFTAILTLASVVHAQDKAKAAPAAPAAKAAPAAAAAPAAKAAEIDINSASEAELRTLTGIGEARAAAIIKGRPYKRKDELVQKKILTQGVYDGVKDKIIARQKA